MKTYIENILKLTNPENRAAAAVNIKHLVDHVHKRTETELAKALVRSFEKNDIDEHIGAAMTSLRISEIDADSFLKVVAHIDVQPLIVKFPKTSDVQAFIGYMNRAKEGLIEAQHNMIANECSENYYLCSEFREMMRRDEKTKLFKAVERATAVNLHNLLPEWMRRRAWARHHVENTGVNAALAFSHPDFMNVMDSIVREADKRGRSAFPNYEDSYDGIMADSAETYLAAARMNPDTKVSVSMETDCWDDTTIEVNSEDADLKLGPAMKVFFPTLDQTDNSELIEAFVSNCYRLKLIDVTMKHLVKAS